MTRACFLKNISLLRDTALSNTRYQLVSFLLNVKVIYVTDNKRCNASLRDPLALVVKRGRIIVFPVVKTPIRCGLFADILVTPCHGEGLRAIV